MKMPYPRKNCKSTLCINNDVIKDDLISRQAAIDAFEDTTFTKNEILRRLSELQSAQSEPKWVLCSERLPEIDMSYPHHENYLVQYDSGYMDVASWSNVNRFWTDHVIEPHWNCVQFAVVIAWMPLPKPWKGENDG